MYIENYIFNQQILSYLVQAKMFLNFTEFSLQTIKGKPPKIKKFYNQGLNLVEIKRTQEKI